jgi:hypothetical protein
MKPRPAKPNANITQVEGSGTADLRSEMAGARRADPGTPASAVEQADDVVASTLDMMQELRESLPRG